MRRLLAICTGIGLLCSAIGCYSTCGPTCGSGNCDSCSERCHVAGRCDVDEVEYGCHFDMYGHGHATVAAPAMPVAPPVETLKPLPKEVKPKEEDEN